ncbi:hypothetical protein M8C21_020912 [Ambrosia artemisiifolia]|uniref:GPI inositol-deacylase n=1 Tax=Ambrosia artemisiifolia TaxID=4212 RepID=A0AAD5BRM1_AMBAR|nr:hypothetical protein M8C21_020912 [Ambrosia artemisiifolia]
MALAPCFKPLQLPSRRSSCSCSAVAQPDSSSTSLSSSPVTYRPAVILPGLGNNTGDYQKLSLTLQGYGVSTVVAKVSRIDWLRNAAGGPLSIIGHSAGGWLARVYMEEFAKENNNISLLLTLGSPLQPPPKGLPGVVDQTRGLLDYVEKNCRNAVYTPELRYVCIAGRYIYGSRLFGNSDPAATIPVSVEQSVPDATIASEAGTLISTGATFRTRFVGQGYKQVCGQADVWGDGVVPEVSAHLEGALNISFDGVYHSPVGSDDESRPWYGSPAIVEQWVHHLLN